MSEVPAERECMKAEPNSPQVKLPTVAVRSSEASPKAPPVTPESLPAGGRLAVPSKVEPWTRLLAGCHEPAPVQVFDVAPEVGQFQVKAVTKMMAPPLLVSKVISTSPLARSAKLLQLPVRL